MTSRRVFLAGAVGLLAAPLVGEAQQAAKVSRVAVISVGTRPTSPTPLTVFFQALHELGWIEGKNLTIDPDTPPSIQTDYPTSQANWSGSNRTSS